MAATYGFSSPGFLARQTLTAAQGEFDGTADKGLVTFAGTGGGTDYGAAAVSPQAVPKIWLIGYEADPAGTAHEVDFFLVRVGGTPGNDRIRIGGSQYQADGTLGLTFAATLACCGGLAVPRTEITALQTYYQLQVFTDGKDSDATLTVWYGMGAP